MLVPGQKTKALGKKEEKAWLLPAWTQDDLCSGTQLRIHIFPKRLCWGGGGLDFGIITVLDQLCCAMNSLGFFCTSFNHLVSTVL